MTDLFDVSGKHIHVTGASSGLGRHFATVLAQRGARVSFGARRLERIEALAKELAGTGGEALAVACDVTSKDSLVSALDASEEAFGPIDALVNNAGTSLPAPVLDLALEDFQSVVKTNLDSVWISSQEIARRSIVRKRACSIVNIASIAAIRTYMNVSPYVASKAGVIALTRNMAVELSRTGVRINAIAPGFFDTELGAEFRAKYPERRAAQIERIPMGRVGEHGELDGALILLVSDASTYMTGTVIVVDGGMSQSAI